MKKKTQMNKYLRIFSSSVTIRYLKNYCKLSANCLAMTPKQELRINYIEEISIKSDAKKDKILSDFKKIVVSFRRILWP